MLSFQRQYFMTLEQIEDAIIQEMVLSAADYTTITTAYSALLAQVTTAEVGVTLHFAAVAFYDGAQLKIQLEIGHGLMSTAVHWDGAIMMNGHITMGVIYADPSGLVTEVYGNVPITSGDGTDGSDGSSPTGTTQIWQVPFVGEQTEGQGTLVVSNGYVWTTDGSTVSTYAVANGAAGPTFSIATIVGNPDSYYAGCLLDNAGVWWLTLSGGDGNPNENGNPQYVRIDTMVLAVKDTIARIPAQGEGGVAPDYEPADYDSSSNLVYAVGINGTPTVLTEIDGTTGEVTNNYTLPFVYGLSTQCLDTTNKRLWLWHNDGTGTFSIIVFDIASQTVMMTTTDVEWPYDMIYVASLNEVIMLDYDPSNDNFMRLTRYNASSMTKILSADLTDSRLDYSQNSGAQSLAPIHYLPWTDEIAVMVGYNAPDSENVIWEIWAYNRQTLAFSRVLIAVNDAQPTIFDFCIDSAQNVYVSSESTGVPALIEMTRYQD